PWIAEAPGLRPALAQFPVGTRLQPLKNLGLSPGPPDGDAPHLGGVPQPEQQSGVVGGKVAAATLGEARQPPALPQLQTNPRAGRRRSRPASRTPSQPAGETALASLLRSVAGLLAGLKTRSGQPSLSRSPIASPLPRTGSRKAGPPSAGASLKKRRPACRTLR